MQLAVDHKCIWLALLSAPVVVCWLRGLLTHLSLTHTVTCSVTVFLWWYEVDAKCLGGFRSGELPQV